MQSKVYFCVTNAEINRGTLSTEFIRTPTRMAPRTGTAQTAAARAARKVKVGGNKPTDNPQKGPPNKPRPKPRRTPLRPTMQHSITPEAASPQRSVINISADSKDGIEYETSREPDGVDGGGHGNDHGDDHGDGDGDSDGGRDNDNGGGSDYDDNCGDDNHDGDRGGNNINDDRVELGGYGGRLARHRWDMRHGKYQDLIYHHKTLTINQRTMNPLMKTMRAKMTIAVKMFPLTSLSRVSTIPWSFRSVSAGMSSSGK
jgi:hypothetical protein